MRLMFTQRRKGSIANERNEPSIKILCVFAPFASLRDYLNVAQLDLADKIKKARGPDVRGKRQAAVALL